MGFEKNFQARIPSNPINKCSMRFYTSKVKQSRLNLQNLKINPWFVTGFTDGEGERAARFMRPALSPQYTNCGARRVAHASDLRLL